MLNNLKNYLYDSNFKIIVLKNKISITNYEEVLIFDESEMLVRTNEFLVKIKGNNLTINRIENKELFIEGIINNIEFR